MAAADTVLVTYHMEIVFSNVYFVSCVKLR